jgi:hypothetical protein
MPDVKPLGKLLEPIVEEGGHEDIGIVLEPCCGNSDEISRPIASQAQCDGREVHPRLKEMEPPNVGLPERGYS